jgi:hypothetical protein
MLKTHSTGGKRNQALAGALAVGAIGVFATKLADAHFRLDAPKSWVVLDQGGDPQKMPPCGNEPPQTMSNVVTPFRPGEKITIQLVETVPHPGFYRVALAVNDQSELPKDPKVTPAAGDPCSTAEYSDNPAFPVLVDHALVHTTAFSGPQTISVTLPTNVTCTKCFLQVIEFMSKHPNNPPGGCFYHHCANISIQGAPADGGVSTDAGKDAASSGAGGTKDAGAGGDAGSSGEGGSGGAGGSIGTAGDTGVSGSTTSSGTVTTGVGGSSSATGGASGTANPSDDTGCSCRVPGRSRPTLAGLGSLVALALAMRRRIRPKSS